MFHRTAKSKAAFTLMELIIVIAIIGIIAGIAIPSIYGYTKMARVESLTNNARTVFLVAQNYFTSRAGNGETGQDIVASGQVTAAELNRILPVVSEQEKTENGNDIYYLTLDKNTENKQSNVLYGLLSSYLTDIDLLEKSILLEYNAKTGIVRSAFVSEAPFLSYAGDIGEKTNVLDRERGSLEQKEQGYYGVDYTGSIPQNGEAPDMAVRIENKDNLLTVECDVADINNTHEVEYVLDILPFDAPVAAPYATFVFKPDALLGDPGFIYDNAEQALAHAGEGNPAVYKTVDLSGQHKIVLILDAFSKYNAYDSTKDLSMHTLYPDIPVGYIDARLTAMITGGGAFDPVYAEEIRHSYFAAQERNEAEDSVAYAIEDARQLNNVRYSTDEPATQKFMQKNDILMETYDKQVVTIAPMDVFLHAYDAQRDGAAVGAPSNYAIKGLRIQADHAGAGLFTSNEGTISNVDIVDATVTGEQDGGIFAGTNASEGTIQNCSASGEVEAGTYVGGVVGVNAGKIENCVSGLLPDPLRATNNNTDIEYATESVSKITAKRDDAAVGGIVGENRGSITGGLNISQVRSMSASGTTGGVVGNNTSGAKLLYSYNAGLLEGTGNKSSVGGVAGANSGLIQYVYNTGRVNVKAGALPDPDEGVLPLSGNMGGIVGHNREDGRLYDAYNINYIAKAGEPDNTAGGGIIGRDETKNAANVRNCSFIAGVDGNTNAMGAALVEHPDVRAVFKPKTGLISLSDYYKAPEWTTTNAVQGTYFYRFPYFAEAAENGQRTPWDAIEPAEQKLAVRIVNGALLTLEWSDADSTTQGGIEVAFLQEDGTMIDTLTGIDLQELRECGSVAEGMAIPLTSTTGKNYPAYYDAQSRTYRIVLDGLALDGAYVNRMENHFRNVENIKAQVTYPGESTAVSNVENTMYAGVDAGASTISNARHLYNVRYRLKGGFVQTADITMQNYDGGVTTILPAGMLEGVYNGNGFGIAQLNVTAETGNAGLFAQIGEAGVVRNVTLLSGVMTGFGDTGAVAGVNFGSIVNCGVRPAFRVAGVGGSPAKNIGGIVGRNGTHNREGYAYAAYGKYNKDQKIVQYEIFDFDKPLKVGDAVYISFETLEIYEHDQSYKNRQILLVGQGGVLYPLFNVNGKDLTISDLQGTNAASGYCCKLTYRADGSLILNEITNTPGGGLRYAGTVEGCVNEASMADTGNAGNVLGGITGLNEGMIKNCTSGTIPAAGMTLEQVLSNATKYETGTAKAMGGIAGFNRGIVEASVNAAMLETSTADVQTGGIVGVNEQTVTQCYNAGSVSATGVGSHVGGIVGQNGKTLTDCYSTGRVNVSTIEIASLPLQGGSIGGVTGYNRDGASVQNCYNIGYVGDSDTGAAGGVIGLNENQDTGEVSVRNVYTLMQANLNKNVVGQGSVLSVDNASVTKDVLMKIVFGSAFKQDVIPAESTYLYPYAYLVAVAHRTAWEDTAVVLRMAEAPAVPSESATAAPSTEFIKPPTQLPAVTPSTPPASSGTPLLPSPSGTPSFSAAPSASVETTTSTSSGAIASGTGGGTP